MNSAQRLGMSIFLGLLLCVGNLVGQVGAEEKLPAGAPASAGYSAASLFNQGNAWARQGKTGLAVLAYERARILKPGDEDVNYNLQFLRAKAGLNEPTHHLLGRMLRLLPANLAAWLGSLGLILAGVGFLLARRQGAWWVTIMVAIGFFLVLQEFGNALGNWSMMQTAVITASAPPARIAPSSLAEVSFQFQEGDVVQVEAEHGDFSLVKTSSDHTGWIANQDLAKLIP